MPTCETMAQCATDADVVADLHLIIDLGAFADDGVVHGAAIDGRIGADLDIVLDDDATDLHDLDHAARAWRITKAVLADTRAIMDDDAVTDERAENAARPPRSNAVAADLDVGPMTAPAPIRVPSPISAPGPMTASGSTTTSLLKLRRRIDDGAGAISVSPT